MKTTPVENKKSQVQKINQVLKNQISTAFSWDLANEDDFNAIEWLDVMTQEQLKDLIFGMARSLAKTDEDA